MGSLKIVSNVSRFKPALNLNRGLADLSRDLNSLNSASDLVIIDRMEEKMDIFELTVPLETNIKNANTHQMNKYEHFITDITTRDVSVHPFEIGSRGYISPSSPSNEAILKKLHKFCKPSVSFKAMCRNLLSLAVLSSSHIFENEKR